MSGASSVQSTAAAALEAAGDRESAVDIGALDKASEAAERKLVSTRRSLVERLIYGPAPTADELQAGGRNWVAMDRPHPVLEAALARAAAGEAFTAEGKISAQVREAMVAEGAYGLTVPPEFGGRGQTYLELAQLEESLCANGLGPMAVEVSGQLTIGAGALLGFGTEEQRSTFLPLVSEGTLIAFALTEVGTGVNAKKIQAYVEPQADGSFRLFADGARNKLWITNASHGGLVAIVARLGKDGSDLGLFITQLPEVDRPGEDGQWQFKLEPSGVDAFTANYNSRLHFYDYPIPAQNRIPGDGVEVLFYSLRLGRCMLASMSAGYQRMLARDASQYAKERRGVGGLVIKHELPQLAIGRMLGGSLQSRALSLLALSQDATGANLAGLRDITKSAAADTGNDSMRAAEHVMGGRAFDRNHRVNQARVNLHLFGIVEGEDDMIRMGMVRDVTSKFVDDHLAPLLGILKTINAGKDGKQPAPDQRVLRIAPIDAFRRPVLTLRVLAAALRMRATYKLAGWIVSNLATDIASLLSAPFAGGDESLPKTLRAHERHARKELRKVRWRYLKLVLSFQLELAGAQIALQRLGLQIEHLVSIMALCHHAAVQDASQHKIAALKSILLREQADSLTKGLNLRNLRKVRDAVADVAEDVIDDSSSLLGTLKAEGYAHAFNSPS